MTSMSSNNSNDRSKILVVGGTGMLGIPVVRQLASDGHLVRVLSSRQPCPAPSSLFGSDSDKDNDMLMKNIEVVHGNVLDLKSLEEAIDGCSGIHINLSGGDLERIGTENIVAAVIAKHIRKKNAKRTTQQQSTMINQITLISGISVCEENAQRFAKTRAKLGAEQALMNGCEGTIISYTIYRCTMFMETLPKWKYLIGNQPTKWHWIAASDYAKMVAIAYTPNSNVQNQILHLCGPGPPLTLREAMDQYYIPICCLSDVDSGHDDKDCSLFCQPKHSPKSISAYPIWKMKLLSWLPGNDDLNAAITKFSWLAQISELGNPQESNDLLGYTPKTTITMWCRGYNEKKKRVN